MELEYADLKNQSAADKKNRQSGNASKGGQSSGIEDEVTLSSINRGAKNQLMHKPSESVTPDEKRALRTQISLFV